MAWTDLQDMKDRLDDIDKAIIGFFGVNSYTGEIQAESHRAVGSFGNGKIMVSFMYDVSEFYPYTETFIRKAWEIAIDKLSKDVLDTPQDLRLWDFTFHVTD